MNIYQYSQPSIEHPDHCEDAVLVFPGSATHAPIFAAIDGMGGHQHMTSNGTLLTGSDAADLIRSVLIEDLEHLPVEIDATPGGEAEQHIHAALLRAHQRLYHELNNSET